MTTSRLLCLLASGVAIAWSTGCSQPGGRVAHGNAEQILYWGNGADPQGLDPQVDIGESQGFIMNALFEGLVSQDPELRPIPGVAERWEISDDGCVYTFHLRADARWSNGEPVTARDFLNSYRRILSPALGAQYAEMFWKDVEVVNAREYFDGAITDFSHVGFEAPDDRTFIVRLRHPAPYFLQMLNFRAWYPVHLPTVLKHGRIDARATAWTRPGNFVGNGPFALRKWQPEDEVVVERNPHYWGAAGVRLKEIRYYPTENIDSEERAFRAGQLHITYELPQAKVASYRRNAPEFLRIEPYAGVYFLRLNVGHPALKDKRVRRALAMAVDRRALVENITRGGQLAAHHFTPPNTAGYTARARIAEDVPAARRLLAEAGFPDGRGLPGIELLINTSENHRAIAEAVQHMWKENLGVEATIRNEEFRVYLSTMHKLDFCAARSGWIADYDDPNSFLGCLVSGGGNNDTGFANPEYDRLIAEANRTLDADARREIFQRAEAILMEEMPVLPLYFYTRVYLIQPSVKGWSPNLIARHMPQFLYLDGAAALPPKVARAGVK